MLITEDEIAAKVKELSPGFPGTYAGKKLLILGVLKGSFVFLARPDPLDCIPCEFEFYGCFPVIIPA